VRKGGSRPLNPIVSGDYPEPSILKDGEDSYIIGTIHYSVDGQKWERYDRGMEVSGYHHNVGYDFLSLRPALYAAGTGEVRFRNFKYRALE
jgi:beta-xylosidase